jgi:glycosyltransferase involved in cell wall biosynthesis
MPKTTIVVPCFNEASRLPVAEFRRFAAKNDDVRFLLVNDGSRDNTSEILDSLVTVDGRHFQSLDLTLNGGKAEAVRRGVLQAATSLPDYIGYWDADLATPLEAIPDFISVLDRRSAALVVIGVRLPLLGHEINRRPIRRFLGRCFCRVASFLLRAPLADTQCGAKLFRAVPESILAFSRPFMSRWIFDVELLARVATMNLDGSRRSLDEFVYELPLDKWEDVAGSKLKKGDFFKAFGELSAIWWSYLRPFAPRFVPAIEVLPSSVVADAPQQRRAA